MFYKKYAFGTDKDNLKNISLNKIYMCDGILKINICFLLTIFQKQAVSHRLNDLHQALL